MFFPIISILMSIWLYREAKLRNEPRALWAISGLLFSFLAMGVFHLKYGNRTQGIVALLFGIVVYSFWLADFVRA